MNLKKDEKIIEILQGHFYMHLCLSIAIAFATTLLLYSSREEYILTSKVILAVSVYLLIFSKLYYLNQRNLITTAKVYIQQGLVFAMKAEIPFGRIKDIVVQQSLIQRLCDAGDLCIVTEKSKYFILRISHPNKIKELIQQQVFKSKRVGL